MSDQLAEISDRIIVAANAGTLCLSTAERSAIDKQQRGFRLSASEMILLYQLAEKLEEINQ